MEERSKSALEALLRVRNDGTEKASVELGATEKVLVAARATLAAARAELEAHLQEREALQAESLGGEIRPGALAGRGAYLAVVDGRAAAARALVATREQDVATAEAALESRRRALIEANAQARAVSSRLEAIARSEARGVERANEDEALEAHVARRS